jgi:hypothetical protein
MARVSARVFAAPSMLGTMRAQTGCSGSLAAIADKLADDGMLMLRGKTWSATSIMLLLAT